MSFELKKVQNSKLTTQNYSQLSTQNSLAGTGHRPYQLKTQNSQLPTQNSKLPQNDIILSYPISLSGVRTRCSILASSGMAADGLSTAAFVLGAEKGLELIKSIPQTGAIATLKNGRILTTDNFGLISDT